MVLKVQSIQYELENPWVANKDTISFIVTTEHNRYFRHCLSQQFRNEALVQVSQLFRLESILNILAYKQHYQEFFLYQQRMNSKRTEYM